MELEATREIPRASKPKRNKNNRKNKTCYVYSKPGYFARNYRLKNIISQRQLDTTIKNNLFEK